MRNSTTISVRRACWLVGLSRTVLSYAIKPDPEAVILRDRLTDLAGTRRRFGYRRLHALLRREGVAVNHKRLYRLYREAGLSVRRRRRRRGVAVLRQPLTLPTAPNQVWSMDFVMDALDSGRRLKCLTIVDDFTKESIDIVVDHSIPGLYVTRVLDQAVAFRGCHLSA
jgi:putative transposase